MLPNLTAAVDALARRAEQATGVDGINVDKDTLAALIEAWRCWQMVEAMPKLCERRYTDEISEYDTEFTPDWVCLMATKDRFGVGYRVQVGLEDAYAWYSSGTEDPAAALAAAFKEGGDGE